MYYCYTKNYVEPLAIDSTDYYQMKVIFIIVCPLVVFRHEYKVGKIVSVTGIVGFIFLANAAIDKHEFRKTFIVGMHLR